MRQRQRGQGINGVVQPVPAGAAQAFDHAVCRGDSQHHKSEQGHKTYGQVKPQDDFTGDLDQIIALLCDVKRQMHQHIGQCREAQHAAHDDQLWPVGNGPQRRDEQRDQQKAHGPVAGVMDRVSQRLGAKHAAKRFRSQERHRHDAGEQHGRFEPGKAACPVIPRINRSVQVEAPASIVL